MPRDIRRVTLMHEIPYTSSKTDLPPKFPVNTLLPMRILTALSLNPHPRLSVKVASQRFFHLFFKLDQDVSDSLVLEKSLTPELNSRDWIRLLEEASSDGVKTELMEVTNRVVQDLGGFGLPILVAEKSVQGKEETLMVFGSDRMDHLSWFFNQPLPFPSALLPPVKL